MSQFATDLWDKYNSLMKSDRKDEALYTVFDSLLTTMINGKSDDCNSFLTLLMKNKLSSNLVVHVLNVLSPRKHLLSEWDRFVSASKAHLSKEYRKEEVEQILKVIR